MIRSRVPSSNRSVPRGLWWVSPAGSWAFVVIPTILLTMYISDANFRFSWGTPKYFTAAFAVILLQGAALFMSASAIPLITGKRRPESRPWPGLSDRTLDRLTSAANVLFWLTMIGYIVYGVVGVARGARPEMFLTVLVDQNNVSGNLKDLFAPVTGVTTLTQVGIAYLVIAIVVLLHRKQAKMPKRLAIIIVLGFMRAFFLTERLAILELVVPAIALLVMAWSGHPRFGVRAMLRWAPIVLVPGAIAMFGLFEFSRSWQFYQQKTGGSFVDFAIDRFAGYYVTAYNNGQIALNWEHFPGRLPYRTLEFFWTAPGVSQVDLYDRVSHNGSGLYMDLLDQYGNVEFNNPCGLCDPFVDYGVVGGTIWLIIAGLLLGFAYRAFANGHLWSLLIYPPLFTGLLEMPRYIYWTQGRFFPAWVTLILVIIYVRWPDIKKRTPEEYSLNVGSKL